MSNWHVEYGAFNSGSGGSATSGGRRHHSSRHAVSHLSNRPEPYEQHFREPGADFITQETETRVANCVVFKFDKEDHTLGNLLRDQVLKNRAVLFSGYKVPHPIVSQFELRIQTDGSVTPKQALLQACEEIVQDCNTLSREFTKEWELQRLKVSTEDQGPSAT